MARWTRGARSSRRSGDSDWQSGRRGCIWEDASCGDAIDLRQSDVNKVTRLLHSSWYCTETAEAGTANAGDMGWHEYGKQGHNSSGKGHGWDRDGIDDSSSINGRVNQQGGVGKDESQVHLSSVGGRSVPKDAEGQGRGRPHQWKDALGGLERNRQVVVSQSLCDAGGEREQWKIALQSLKHMPGKRVDVSVVSYRGAIQECERCGQWEGALELLGQMPSRSFQPDALCYSATISACEKNRHWQKALKLLCEMRRWGLEPDLVAYAAVADTCLYTSWNSLGASIASGKEVPSEGLAVQTGDLWGRYRQNRHQ